MKKILSGLLSVFLTANASAGLLSLKIHESELVQHTPEQNMTIAATNDIYGVTVDFQPINSSRTLNHSSELYGSQGQIIGQLETIFQDYYLDLFSFEHVYQQNFTSFKLQFDELDFALTRESMHSVFAIANTNATYLDEQSSDELYGLWKDSTNILLQSSSFKFKTQEINGLTLGYRMEEKYAIRFGKGAELDFSNYDEIDEILMAIENDMFNDYHVFLSHTVSIKSFERTDPSVSYVSCLYCDGITITSEESYSLNSYGHFSDINSVEVQEPSSSILLALGLMSLLRLKRHALA